MKSVLIFVFDGLQPSQVTHDLMPNLADFVPKGVTFANHHSVFPTVTRINAASMVTGLHPGGHGIAGNTMVFRDFDPDRAISVIEPELAQIVKKTGRVLLAPTLADILSQHGQEYIAIGTGISGNAYIHNPNAERVGGATIHPEFTLPYGLYDEIIAKFGPWPKEMVPNISRMSHALRIMTEYILLERMPAVSLIWLSEPDKSQHVYGVGSDIANAALKSADEEFGKLMRWLKKNGLADETDVIVLSDHGYSTIGKVIGATTLIRYAGFQSGKDAGVVLAPNGGSILIYPQDRIIARLMTRWLMAQPWCGTILASEAMGDIPGTLPASLVGDEGPRVPDITISFQWNSRLNSAGYRGYANSTGGAPGLGQHGSMSKHDLKNVMFAWGPSFKQDLKLHIPSGNIDIAPTILHILGIFADYSMDGRVLKEALVNGIDPGAVRWSRKIHKAEQRLTGKTYRQQITISRVGTTTYVDEGRASRRRSC